MKTIGIGGHSTTGKSTLARLIKSNSPKAEVISLDYVLDDIKKKISKEELIEVYHGDGNLIQLPNNPFREIENQNIKRLYFFARSIFITSVVNQKLLKLYRDDYELAIVEGVNIESLYISFDYLIRTKAQDDIRLKRRQIRDKLKVDKETLHEWDRGDNELNHQRKINYNKIILNEMNIEEYGEVAYKIYKKIITSTR